MVKMGHLCPAVMAVVITLEAPERTWGTNPPISAVES
jgi:hypothetical protein